MEPVVQFTCRDRNRLGMQADLLGAAVFGINTSSASAATIPSGAIIHSARRVYDMDSINLIRMARMMRDNQVFENGKNDPEDCARLLHRRGREPLCAAVRIPALCGWPRRSSPGAQFIQTQLIFNVDRFREFMKRVVDLGLARAGSNPGRRRPDQVAEGGRIHGERSGRHGRPAVRASTRLEARSRKKTSGKAGIDICAARSPTRCVRSRAFGPARHGRQLAGMPCRK